MNVFISYARADAEIARRINEVLSDAGLETFFDLDVAPGANGSLELGQALEDSDAMVALISPAFTASKWCEQELLYALGQERFKGRLVPIIVRSTKRAPWILDRLQTIDLDDDPEGAARAAIEVLRKSKRASRGKSGAPR